VLREPRGGGVGRVSLRLPPPEGGDLRRRPIRPGRQRGRVTPRGRRAELTFAKRCCAALGVLAAAVSCCVLLQLRGHAGVHHWAIGNHFCCSLGIRESLWLFTGRSGITSAVHVPVRVQKLHSTAWLRFPWRHRTGSASPGVMSLASLPMASCHWLRFPWRRFTCFASHGVIGLASLPLVLFHRRCRGAVPLASCHRLRRTSLPLASCQWTGFPWRPVTCFASLGVLSVDWLPLGLLGRFPAENVRTCFARLRGGFGLDAKVFAELHVRGCVAPGRRIGGTAGRFRWCHVTGCAVVLFPPVLFHWLRRGSLSLVELASPGSTWLPLSPCPFFCPVCFLFPTSFVSPGLYCLQVIRPCALLSC
jgi:hypothetical protein